MLAEKILYSEDFPINIRIGQIVEDPLHFQPDLELVFVLKGELQVKNGCSDYLLKQGDIFANNPGEIHGFYNTGKENLAAVIQFSTRYYESFFPGLAQSCYFTYNSDTNRLKHLLLTLLLNYLKRSLNYKQECTELGEEVIDCLSSYFNLFAFEDSSIVPAPNEDPVQTERLSRIFTRIYADHAQKLSLEEIAAEEGLSVFYLSHLIHDFVGLNFREFLCYTRVEVSQRLLLQPNCKIASVAKSVGFSTTAYYEKYFQKWFGQTPLEYREHYLDKIKSSANKETFEEEPLSNAIFIVRRLLSSLEAQTQNNRIISGLKTDERVDSRAMAVKKVRPEVYITITLQDYQVLKHRLFHHLDLLAPKVLYLAHTPEDDPTELQQLKDLLIRYGHPFREKAAASPSQSVSFGQDSIAMLPYLLTHGILGNSPIRVRLSDPGVPNALKLQGSSGLLTSSGMPKPAYYACTMLAKMQGDLLSWSANHAIIRMDSAYFILVFNYDDETHRLCTEPSTLHETDTVINQFHQQLDLNFTLTHLSGKYTITKYIHTGQDSVFDMLSKLDFPDNFSPSADLGLESYTAPRMDLFTETVSSDLTVNFSLGELGSLIVVIEPA